jgi:hypothetical protein
MMEYLYVFEKEPFGNIYPQVYAKRSNHYIILTSPPRDYQAIDPFQTGWFYIMFFLVASDFKHKEDR